MSTPSPFIKGRDVGLIGRSTDMAVLSCFVEQAVVRGAAMLVTGDPGVRKTALLEEVAGDAAAIGVTVLRAAGVEFEADVSYAGLHQLLLPLLDDLQALAPPHREALAVAIGLGAGPPPHRLLVSAAVLELLVRASERRPVVAIVDDLPWVDRSSMRVLGFVARRLADSTVGLLAAARTGSDVLLLRAGLPELELLPLAESAAEELLRARFPDLAGRIRDRVLAASEGNPLALLQLPAVLSDEQRSGSVDLPALPLGRRLHTVLARQLVLLPPATRWLLLLAALERTGDAAVQQAAAGCARWLDALAPRDLVVPRRGVEGDHPVWRRPAQPDPDEERW